MKVITKFLVLILTLNKHPHSKHLNGEPQWKIHIPTFALIYLRFMYDIFFMWTDSKKDLENLLNELNRNTDRLTLNAKYPKKEFLF